MPEITPNQGQSAVDGVQGEMVPVQRVSDSPRLYLVEDFASREEVEYIMQMSEPNLTPIREGAETGTRVELEIDGDPILEEIRRRMHSVFPTILGDEDLPASTFRVRRYKADGFSHHPPHVDFYHSESYGETLVLTIMLYLTSPEAGGETHFPHAHDGSGYSFSPIAGNLACWWSIYGEGEGGEVGARDPRTLHSGAKVKKGEKWNATYFVYVKSAKRAGGVESASEIFVPKVTEAMIMDSLM
eukprot:CAMPEP_0197521594 /NCGR_PEP_ID=MMETSP1318-20131121/6864_1 /TAXON_ID=552666 /ORGANISM="Partenskyella glossopodia, Strain RCC365" /LENGTH=242 /DNA_ID=CAMNT_0043073651 /DNA_START=182 /DNA_END=910 /DNA_ORIENTATION=-